MYQILKVSEKKVKKGYEEWMSPTVVTVNAVPVTNTGAGAVLRNSSAVRAVGMTFCRQQI